MKGRSQDHRYESNPDHPPRYGVSFSWELLHVTASTDWPSNNPINSCKLQMSCVCRAGAPEYSGHSAHAVLTSLGAHALGRLPKATYVPWGRPEAAGSFHSSRLGGVFCNSHLAINRWAFSCSSGLGTYSSFQLGTPTRRILFVSIACPQKFSSHTVSGAGLKSAEHPFLGRSEPPVGKATELFFLQRFLAMAQSASFPPPRGPALRGRRTDPCGAWLAAVSPK